MPPDFPNRPGDVFVSMSTYCLTDPILDAVKVRTRFGVVEALGVSLGSV